MIEHPSCDDANGFCNIKLTMNLPFDIKRDMTHGIEIIVKIRQ